MAAAVTVAGLRVRWLRLCCDLGAPDAAAARWWGTLEGSYGAPSRAYHTLEHLSEMFGYMDEHAAALSDAPAVGLAIFFHDVVYDARAGSPKNEADSARVFEEFAQEALPAGSPPGRAKGELIEKVYRWIVQTAHHKCGPADEEDCRLFMDFDMAVLGRPWPAYEEYSRQIRREYAHVPEALYCRARAGFLSAFSAGADPVFATEAFRREREARARANAGREAEALRQRLGMCSAPARLGSGALLWLKAAPRRHGPALKACGVAAAAAAVALRTQLVLAAAAAGSAASLALAAPLAAWLAVGAPFRRYPYAAPSRREGVAVLAGSFNPPHLGHLQMLTHLAAAHETVYAVIGVNPSKRYAVSAYERQELMRSMLQELGLDNVRVVVHAGIIWKFARSAGATVMYRGIRSWRLDGCPEKWLELLNIVTQLGSGRCPLPTAYLQANPEFAAVSSTLLRGRVERRQDISHLVPPGCANAVTAAYSRR